MSLIVLAAGGTGGHVFPAMALARALSARGHDVRLLTDARGVKYATDFDPDGIEIISAGGLVSGAPHKRVRGLLRLGRGYVQARGHLKRWKPDAAERLLPQAHRRMPGGARIGVKRLVALGGWKRPLDAACARVATWRDSSPGGLGTTRQ